MSRVIPLDRYRNIGLLACADAGRTTTTERMLAVARRAGDAEPSLPLAAVPPAARGAAVEALPELDDLNHRDITLTSAATGCAWRETRINIVELLAGRTGAVAAPMSVLDGLVLVLDGSAGVSEVALAALNDAARADAARLIFVNKLDRVGASFATVLDDLAAGAGPRPVAIQMPFGAGFAGVVDLIEMRAISWSRSDLDAAPEPTVVPAALQAEAAAARARLAALLGLDADATPSALRAGLREATLLGRAVPVLCGSAFLGRGLEALLDAVVDLLPAPSELDGLHGEAADGTPALRQPSDDEPFSGVAFGQVNDPAEGSLVFLRIFSGVVATGGAMLNTVSASPERIGRMVRMHANHAEVIGEARAGDIVAVAGLEHTATGDTLCDPAAPLVVGRFPLKRVPASSGRGAPESYHASTHTALTQRRNGHGQG